jgi:Lon protease-like protein
MQMYSDGRMDILTRGRRRFEVLALNEEKDYLQGEVNFFDDEDFSIPPPELRDEALSRFKELSSMGAAKEEVEPDLADPQLSFQLAQAVPDVDFLSSLLRQRSESRRLKQLSEFLAEFIPRQRMIDRMKELAPTNGFGRKPAGL